jgi:hypothetical protein
MTSRLRNDWPVAMVLLSVCLLCGCSVAERFILEQKGVDPSKWLGPDIDMYARWKRQLAAVMVVPSILPGKFSARSNNC